MSCDIDDDPPASHAIADGLTRLPKTAAPLSDQAVRSLRTQTVYAQRVDRGAESKPRRSS
jgi:hypothetical protein